MAPKTNGLQDCRPEAPVARMEAPRDAQPSGSDRGTAAKSSAAPFVEQQPLGPDGKLEQSCDWCNKPFALRRGTGGTKQKFCSRDCQRTSNRSASVRSVEQRTLRRRPHLLSHSPHRTKSASASPLPPRSIPGKQASSILPTASARSSWLR